MSHAAKGTDMNTQHSAHSWMDGCFIVSSVLHAFQPDVWPDVERTRGGSGRTTRSQAAAEINSLGLLETGQSIGVMSLLLNNIFDT